MRFLLSLIAILGISSLSAQQYVPSRERPSPLSREFRSAWSACIYNLDWPSSPRSGPAQQQAELITILNKMKALKMNAIIFQVRPNSDAVYASQLEPWSAWVSGSMGRSPGYDPLQFCIQQAHARGIEVHAWFNPFRALPNASLPASNNHVTRSHPNAIRRFKSYLWLDPSSGFARSHALRVMMDVVRRYDIDGLHIDDYFYPYPDVAANGRALQQFPDGLSPKQRRSIVDGFVRDMYHSVKRAKPWVRVGISPFGIWRPGVPGGTTASIDSFEHLAADSRKWLNQGWCDYLAPQLYWRINSEQGYATLLHWWRQQGERPVWPGIATARIGSSEDPGRGAGEIINQVALSRKIGRNWVGHCHWSVKSLMQNRGGISSALAKNSYREAAIVPPMPWLSREIPPQPAISARAQGDNVRVSWNLVREGRKYAIQVKTDGRWRTLEVLGGGANGINLPFQPEAIAVSSVDAFGTASSAAVVQLR